MGRVGRAIAFGLHEGSKRPYCSAAFLQIKYDAAFCWRFCSTTATKCYSRIWDNGRSLLPSARAYKFLASGDARRTLDCPATSECNAFWPLVKPHPLTASLGRGVGKRSADSQCVALASPASDNCTPQWMRLRIVSALVYREKSIIEGCV